MTSEWERRERRLSEEWGLHVKFWLQFIAWGAVTSGILGYALSLVGK